MDRPEPLALETETGPDTLDRIEALLKQAWSTHEHVPGPVRMQVGIAAGEIGANIIEHSARGGTVRIRMEVRVLPDAVRVEFFDQGVPLDVDLGSAHMPDAMAERGRGLALARAALAELHYRRDESNHWTLISKPFD